MRVFPSLTPQDEFNELRDRNLTGSINDMQFGFLSGMGFSGSLNDRLKAYSASPGALFADTVSEGVWYDPSAVANTDWRRNLLTYSEDFTNAAWLKYNAAVAGGFSDPDGGVTAFKLTEDTSTTNHSLYRTGVSGTSRLQVLAKAAERSWLVFDGQTGSAAYFDLGDGVLGSTSGNLTDPEIEPQGDGWYKCSVTITTTTAAFFGFMPSTGDGVRVYTGDGASGVYLWHPQLETGSTATDYQKITDVHTEVRARFPNATLYQDAAGTQPVTAPAQTAALVLSKAQGLTLGPELADDTAVLSGSGWVDNGDGSYTHSGTTSGEFQLAVDELSDDQTYAITYTVLSGQVLIQPGGAGADNYSATEGTETVHLVSASTGTTNRNAVRFISAVDNTVIQNISVKHLPGHHASQSTASKRPTYGIVPQGGRRNLLTYTEDLTNGVWGYADTQYTPGAEVSPDGLSEVGKITATGAGPFVEVYQNSATLAGLMYSQTFYFKDAGLRYVQIVGPGAVFGTFHLNIDLQARGVVDVNVGTSVGLAYSAEGVENGYTRVVISAEALSNSSIGRFAVNFIKTATTGRGVDEGAFTAGSGYLIWHPQFETGASATDYQKVVSQYEVTEAGVPSLHYLSFDGVDDALVTPSIDFTGTDEMSVFAGVRHLSDAAAGILLETSQNLGANTGSIFITAPDTGGSKYAFASKGTGAAFAVSPQTYAAPTSNVVTGVGDISSDTSVVRINGTQAGSSAADQGTGNFGNHPLYIGARAGTSLYFNGHLYGLAIAGKVATDTEIGKTERYLAGKTGVTL